MSKKIPKQGDIVRKVEDIKFSIMFYATGPDNVKHLDYDGRKVSPNSVYLVLGRDHGKRPLLLLHEHDGFVGWCESMYFEVV